MSRAERKKQRAAANALDDYSRALQGKPTRYQLKVQATAGCIVLLLRLTVLFLIIYFAVKLAT